jgi:hypothetical protein
MTDRQYVTHVINKYLPNYLKPKKFNLLNIHILFDDNTICLEGQTNSLNVKECCHDYTINRAMCTICEQHVFDSMNRPTNYKKKILCVLLSDDKIMNEFIDYYKTNTMLNNFSHVKSSVFNILSMMILKDYSIIMHLLQKFNLSFDIIKIIVDNMFKKI